MIHYALRCAEGHGFDGWFKGSAEFDRLAQAHLLSCPHCGVDRVDRAMMAPRISKGKRGQERTQPDIEPSLTSEADTAPPNRPLRARADGAAVSKPAPNAALGAPIPDAVRAVLAKLRAEVEAQCDYVGDRFADEARRIHQGSAPARGIYGEATRDDVEMLIEDGIDVTPIPLVPRADS